MNDALDDTPFGADLQATLQSDGITIFITDAKGRELADNRDANGDRLVEVAGGGVTVSQRANTATDNYFQYGEPEVAVSQDRLIYKSYEDRSKNEGTDDDAYVGSSVSLGEDNYANDLVIDFDTDKVYVLGQSPGVISVSVGTAATMVLTGFEVLQDWGGSDDIYTMEDLDDVLGDLFLVDDLYSDAPGTVSYTHLDVYKRQYQSWPAQFILKFFKTRR